MNGRSQSQCAWCQVRLHVSTNSVSIKTRVQICSTQEQSQIQLCVPIAPELHIQRGRNPRAPWPATLAEVTNFCSTRSHDRKSVRQSVKEDTRHLRVHTHSAYTLIHTPSHTHSHTLTHPNTFPHSLQCPGLGMKLT